MSIVSMTGFTFGSLTSPCASAAGWSAPGFSAVESALAMFSAITRMRPDWTLRPDAATEIVLRKSMAYFPRPTAVRSICRLF